MNRRKWWAAFGALAMLGCAGLARAVKGEARVRGRVAGGVANVAVWLEDGVGAGPAREAKLRVVWPAFEPRVQVVGVGTHLVLENQDDFLHTARGRMGSELLFNVAQVAQGWPRRVLLEREGVIEVSCAVHRAMRATIVVTRSRLHAVSGAGGRFEIAGVPPGRYRVRAWHEGVVAREDSLGEVVATIDVKEPLTELELRPPARRAARGR